MGAKYSSGSNRTAQLQRLASLEILDLASIDTLTRYENATVII